MYRGAEQLLRAQARERDPAGTVAPRAGRRDRQPAPARPADPAQVGPLPFPAPATSAHTRTRARRRRRTGRRPSRRTAPPTRGRRPRRRARSCRVVHRRLSGSPTTAPRGARRAGDQLVAERVAACGRARRPPAGADQGVTVPARPRMTSATPVRRSRRTMPERPPRRDVVGVEYAATRAAAHPMPGRPGTGRPVAAAGRPACSSAIRIAPSAVARSRCSSNRGPPLPPGTGPRRSCPRRGRARAPPPPRARTARSPLRPSCSGRLAGRRPSRRSGAARAAAASRGTPRRRQDAGSTDGSCEARSGRSMSSP